MAAKNTDTLKFEYKGMDFECVPSVVRNYRMQKAISMAERDPVAYYDALSAMFGGRDEEYAEALGGDMADIGGLYMAAVEAVAAKN